jgi:hypothetical protein
MLENYITPSKDTPSRSGLYANQLPGVTLNLFSDLTKEDQEDWEEFWDDLYERCIINFISSVQAKLADKFHIDLKLLSRETSTFIDEINDSMVESGIKITYRLPKYGKTNIISIEVFSDIEQPGFTLYFRDKDVNGRLLKTVQTDLLEGLNIVYIDQSFSVDELFISYDADLFQVHRTTTKYYNDYYQYTNWDCVFPCYGSSSGTISHINGGGLNVIFNATCSIEKVVEQNINIFKESFWYTIGLELMHERVHSDRFNRFTTLLEDRAKDLIKDYEFWVDQKLTNAIRSIRMIEDPVCFVCKRYVTQSYELP